MVGSTSGQLDPTLHEEAMLKHRVADLLRLRPQHFQRHLGSSTTARKKVEVVQPKFDARPPIAPPVQTGPVVIPPPPINLKFFGTSTSASGDKKAFLLGGDDVFLAAQGDIVQRKYRVDSISTAPSSSKTSPTPTSKLYP